MSENERLMFHFGSVGPVEVEVWDEENEDSTHVFTEYPEGKTTVDLTRDLRRAGYKLVEVDE